MSACANSSVKTEGGVSVRMGIFDPLVLRGVPLNGLETLVDFVSLLWSTNYNEHGEKY